MDWTPLLTIFEKGTVTAAGLAATGGISLAAAWLRKHLPVLGGAAASTTLANMNTIVQSAVSNAAGAVVAQIQTGQLSLTDKAGLQAAASLAAEAVKAKVPQALSILQPAEGVIAEMVLQKAHLAVAAPAVASVVGAAASAIASVVPAAGVVAQVADALAAVAPVKAAAPAQSSTPAAG